MAGRVVSGGGGPSVSPPVASGSSAPKVDFGQMLKRIQAAQSTLPAPKKRPFGGTSLSTARAPKKSQKSNPTTAVDWPSKFRALREHPQSPQWVVGIDMSLTNPGLCLLNPHLQLIHLFAFRNRQKERNGQATVNCPNSLFHGWLVRTTVIEEWPDPEGTFPFHLPRLARYETRIQSLLGLIGENRPEQPMVVGLEHYAFAAGATRGDSTLKELGGILRRQLCHMKHRVLEIVPSQVKRIFCQKGDAKKKDMYRAYRDLYHLPDLMALLHIQPGDTSLVAEPPKKKKKPAKAPLKTASVPKDPDDVPHPVEDLVDALAVALSVIAKTY